MLIRVSEGFQTRGREAEPTSETSTPQQCTHKRAPANQMPAQLRPAQPLAHSRTHAYLLDRQQAPRGSRAGPQDGGRPSKQAQAQAAAPAKKARPPCWTAAGAGGPRLRAPRYVVVQACFPALLRRAHICTHSHARSTYPSETNPTAACAFQPPPGAAASSRWCRRAQGSPWPSGLLPRLRCPLPPLCLSASSSPSFNARSGAGRQRRSEGDAKPPPPSSPPSSGSSGSGGGKPLGGRAIQALLHEREGSSAALLAVIEEHVAGFEKQNCAMAMNRCGWLLFAPSPLLFALLKIPGCCARKES